MQATEYSIQNNIFSFQIKHEIINSLHLHSSKNNIKKEMNPNLEFCLKMGNKKIYLRKFLVNKILFK